MLDFYRRIWIDGLPVSDALWLARKRLRVGGAPVGIRGAWVLAGNPE